MMDERGQIIASQRIGQTCAVDCPPPEPELTRILERLRSLAADASGHARAVVALESSLFGPAPETADKQDCRPARAGLLGHFEDALDSLNGELMTMGAALNHIGSAIPR